jgi:hypothetical protein
MLVHRPPTIGPLRLMPAKAGSQGNKHLPRRSWPPLFAGVTNEGRNHLSEAYHRWMKSDIPHPRSPSYRRRPVPTVPRHGRQTGGSRPSPDLCTTRGTRWTNAVRPSRRPLARPQHDAFLNATKDIRHPEERPKGASRMTHGASAGHWFWASRDLRIGPAFAGTASGYGRDTVFRSVPG